VTAAVIPAQADESARPTGDLDRDARALETVAAEAEQALAALPIRPERSPDQQAIADRAFEAARTARRAFLRVHVDAVYDVLTEERTRHVRLPELVRRAAVRFPGLVPTEAQSAAESAVIQAHKEGREIDQGVFCAAVLHSPKAGRHLIEAMLTPNPEAVALLPEFRRTGRLALDTVLVELQDGAAHVTFHNAHALNAEDNALIRDLDIAVDLALLDDRVTVGVLRGGPVDHPRYAGRRIFSAGINLKDLRNGDISFVGFLMGRELGYVHKLRRGVLIDPSGLTDADRTIQKPWIAAVDGFAIGGGMQLLLTVDHVIADQDAYFSLPAAEEGIVPGLGNLRLTRIAGARLARQIILGGRRIAASEPDARLLCDVAVPADRIDEAIAQAVRTLGAPAVAANRRMLNLVEEPLDLYREYLAQFAVIQSARAHSPDVLAKVERRWQRSSRSKEES